jgi:predicted nucleic acid-binding protein
MLLLDTSVWIDLLADRRTEAVSFCLQRESTEGIALTEMIYLEVLQGARTEAIEARIRENLRQQEMLFPSQGLETFEQAASLYRSARRKGFTVRTAVDCLIAQIAIEHGALLVHNDRDYFAIAEVEPRLQLYPNPRFH